MPIYEYGCESCGHQFEISQKLADEPLKTCPECGKDELRKLISATSFVLKGGGWYKDGYGAPKGTRTENQRADRLQKAIDDDKKKTAAASESSGSSSSSSESSSSAPAASTTSSSSDKAAAGS